MIRRPLLLLVLALAACGDDGGSSCPPDNCDPDAALADAAPIDADLVDAAPADAAVDAPPAGLTLTSTAITMGGAIPVMYSCRGANVSPPLTWTDVGAASYAVKLTDLSNSLIHSIIYDIPGTVTSLPENVMKVYQPPVPAGARQPFAYDNQTRGYLGPCPGSMHTYQFEVFALDVATLPGLTMGSNRAAVNTAILAHDTASATLTATFTP